MIFTGEWSMPVREAEATNALVDAGCDVITCHVDSPKVVIETAEKRGVKTCGHNASQAPLAPKGFITGAEYKWETIYKDYAANARQGRDAAQLHRRRLRHDMVQNTPFGAGAAEEARKAAATAAIADLKAKKPIYVGPAEGQQGQGRHRQATTTTIPTSTDELSARRRRRLDHLTALHPGLALRRSAAIRGRRVTLSSMGSLAARRLCETQNAGGRRVAIS